MAADNPYKAGTLSAALYNAIHAKGPTMPTTILDNETAADALHRRMEEQAAEIAGATIPPLLCGQMLRGLKDAAHTLAEIQALGVLLGERNAQTTALRGRIVAIIAAADPAYYGNPVPAATEQTAAEYGPLTEWG